MSELVLSDVRAQLAAAHAAEGLRAYPTEQASIEVPAATIGNPELIQYHQTARGGTEVDLEVTYWSAQTDETAAIAELDTWLGWGPDSLVRAVERHDPAGAWRTIAAAVAGSYESRTVGESTVMTARVRFTITT